MPRYSTFCLFLLGFSFYSGCSTQPGIGIDPTQYSFLAQRDSASKVIWRKVAGPDFDVYYGRPKNSKTAGFGFYIGGHPNFHPESEAKTVIGKLGAFSVQWYETRKSNPDEIHRKAVFDYKTWITKFGARESKYTQEIHVWIYGATDQEILELNGFLDNLELFRVKPEDEVSMVK